MGPNNNQKGVSSALLYLAFVQKYKKIYCTAPFASGKSRMSLAFIGGMTLRQKNRYQFDKIIVAFPSEVLKASDHEVYAKANIYLKAAVDLEITLVVGKEALLDAITTKSLVVVDESDWFHRRGCKLDQIRCRMLLCLSAQTPA